MTPIADIIAAAHPTANGFVAHVPTDWLQGRTAYGGLSSALALHAAQRCEPDLPPLRTAQIAFIGPRRLGDCDVIVCRAGAITVAATMLRRGRTAAFVQVDITSEAKLGYRATFVFMAAQPSRIDLHGGLTTTIAPPAADAKLYTGPDTFFTGNFTFYDVRSQAPGRAEWMRWARLRARDALDPMVEVLAVAAGRVQATRQGFRAAELTDLDRQPADRDTHDA